jgi:hypothetical protein
MRQWIMSVSGIALIGVIGVLLGPSGTNNRLAPLVLLLIAATTGGYFTIARRPLRAGEPQAVVEEHRNLFFMGVALANTPAVWGRFSLSFLASPLVLVAGVATSLALLALQAPTEASVRREDERPQARGLPFTLSEALRDDG